MKIPGVKIAKYCTRWIQARILGGALILGYHRVAEVTSDEYEVCVTPVHFAEQMETLRKYAHPISLSKLIEDLKKGSIHPKSVAVTFDDGYADNLYNAKTILENYVIPATVFVCTGYAGKEFWWDELERLVISSQAKLSALRLEIGKYQFMWNQPKASYESGLNSRSKFLQELYNFLLLLDIEAQDYAMDVVRCWSGSSSNEPATRALTQDELLQLADNGLIEIGAHTRFHPWLPQLSLERQREEILGSKLELEALLGKHVDGFSYPNGKAIPDAKQIVREAGNFAFACTSEPNLVRSYEHRYEIPRFWPRDLDGCDFFNWLRRWL